MFGSWVDVNSIPHPRVYKRSRVTVQARLREWKIEDLTKSKKVFAEMLRITSISSQH